MKIDIFGSNALAVATGKGLIKHANEVTYIEADTKNVDRLKAAGLRATTTKAFKKITSDITMFCLPDQEADKRTSLAPLFQALEAHAACLKKHKKYHLIVVRATLPPKTTRTVIVPLLEKTSGKKAGKDFGVVVQPDFLRSKTIEQDSARPWFILIGQLDKKSGDTLEKIYAKFDAPIERMSLEEAEFQKYVHNAFNAVKISFFNEMRAIAKKEKWNADAIFHATAESSEGIWNPLYGMRDHGSIDDSAIATDVATLISWATENGHSTTLINSNFGKNTVTENTKDKDA